jgi:gamma-glutamylcyclotransferase (GGCT)/AIG2-like uncharacterized protein YtfP
MFLFVYGTLRRHFENRFARLLCQSANWMGPAVARGNLFLVGDYPGMTEGPRWVRGEVYRLRSPQKVLKMLDRYEGAEYVRRRRMVTIKGGGRICAETYLYRALVNGLRPIPSGIFISPNRTKSR